MLKKPGTQAAGRKHGHRSRQDAVKERPLVSVAYESRSQVYLWTTDRGRKPLIKH